MPEVHHEEIRRSDGKRRYRIKYITDDGEVRVVEREVPDEISISSGYSDIFKNLILWVLIATILMTIFNFFGEGNSKVSASALKNSIASAVKNGADLDVVKTIYENRERMSKGIFSIFDKREHEYPYDVPLSQVLDHIRADLYLGTEKPQDEFVSSINKLISNHNQKNPFDKLTKQQKDYFESVRQKTGDSYPKIQADMNNISDELYSQNLLVETYLSDSRTSLYVSIFSLLFALIVSGYQIYQNRPRKVAENLKVLIEGIFSEPEKQEKDLISQASGTP